MLQTNETTSEFYIGNNIVIDDTEMMLSILEKETGLENIELKDMAEFVESQKATKFYFDRALNGKNILDSRSDIEYLWVDTGFLDTRDRPLFLSLINHKGYFSGHFIGTAHYLAGTVIKYYPENKNKVIENEDRFKEKYKRKIADREIPNLMGRYHAITEIKTNAKPEAATVTVASREAKIREYWDSKPLDITNDIAEILLVNNWQSIRGLDRYIKIIDVRIPQLIEQNKTDYFRLNHIRSAAVNTGLIDKYGSSVCVIYRKHLSFNLYTPQCIIERKSDYVREGFEAGADDLKPVTFMNDEVFDATAETLDISPRALGHIIEERKDRFPEEARTLSEMAIAGKIRNAIDIGLKFQSCDQTYVKPSYSGRDGKIAWLMPLHINREVTEEPELVLVIVKNGQFYEIKTILPYDEFVKDKLTALSLYGRLW